MTEPEVEYHRSRIEIFMDMMRVIKEGKNTQSEILRFANLSHISFKRYVGFLMEKGLVNASYKSSERRKKRMRKVYNLTPEGEKTLNKLESVLAKIRLLTDREIYEP